MHFVRRCTVTIATFFTVLSTSSVALATGPFGFETNVPPTEYSYCSPTKNPDTYLCSSAPKTHSAFKAYAVWYVKDFGLCKVIAIGKSIENDAYGRKSRERADEIVKQIERKYGSYTDKYDFLDAGSIWNDPQYWMAGLSRDERLYQYYWSKSGGYTPVADVTGILVEVNGTDSRTGHVSVGFEFSAFPRCQGAKHDAESEVF